MYNIHTQSIQNSARDLRVSKPLFARHIVSLLETTPSTTTMPTTTKSSSSTKTTTAPSGTKSTPLVEPSSSARAVVPLTAPVSTPVATSSVTSSESTALLARRTARTSCTAEGAHARGVLGVDHARRAGLDRSL